MANDVSKAYNVPKKKKKLFHLGKQPNPLITDQQMGVEQFPAPVKAALNIHSFIQLNCLIWLLDHTKEADTKQKLWILVKKKKSIIGFILVSTCVFLNLDYNYHFQPQAMLCMFIWRGKSGSFGATYVFTLENIEKHFERGNYKPTYTI